MLVTRDYAHAVRIGADGSRDCGSPDIRERNIVVVGDSFTSNLGIEDPSNVFTEVLEQRLGTHNVINLGVNGYGTAQEDLKLKQAMPQYQPDIVMLMFYVRNEFYDNVELFRWMSGYERPLFIQREDGLALTNVPVPRRAPAVHSIKELIVRYSQFAALTDRMLSRTVIGQWIREQGRAMGGSLRRQRLPTMRRSLPRFN